MTVVNAWYPKQLPTKITLETESGRYFTADLTPFREVTEADLQPIAIWFPEMGDEIPDYTLRLYHIARASAPRVKQLRIAAGLTQSQLAQASGVNIRQVQKIESGEIQIGNITLKNAKALADALGTTIDSLLE